MQTSIPLSSYFKMLINFYDTLPKQWTPKPVGPDVFWSETFGAFASLFAINR